MEQEQMARAIKRAARSRKGLAIASALAFGLCGLGWAFVSPAGSSADDDYHLTSIWCATESDALCRTDGLNPGVFVQRKVAYPACYVNWPATQSAACVNDVADEWVYTIRVNSLSEHNPGGFYRFMSLFASTHVNQSVQMMRLVNVALGAVILAWILMLAPFPVSRAVALSWSAALTPIGIFFIASTNPSSWTILGVGSSWAFLLSLLCRPQGGWRIVALSFGLGVSALLALLSRGDAGLYLIISYICALLLARNGREWNESRLRTKALVSGLLLTVVAALVAVSADYFSRYTSGGGALPGSQPATDQPNPLLKMVSELPAFLVGLVGGQEPEYILSDSGANQAQDGYRPSGFIFGLGWAEHQLPSLVGILIAVTTFALVFHALRYWRVNQWLAVALVALGMVGAIVVNRLSDDFTSQNLLQPRYLVPLLVVAVGVMLLLPNDGHRFITRSQAVVATALITVGGTIAWLATAARYAIGPEAAWINFGQQVQWWWPFGPSRLVGGAMMLLATSLWIGIALIAWGTRTEHDKPDRIDAPPGEPHASQDRLNS